MTCPVAAATTGPSVPTRRRGRRARPGWRARARVAKVSSAAVVAALGMGWTPEVCLSIAITLHPTSAVRTGRIRFRSGWGPGGRRFKSCLPDREIACKSALFSPMAEGAEGGRGTNGEQDLSDVCFGPSRMLVGARLVGPAYRAGRRGRGEEGGGGGGEKKGEQVLWVVSSAPPGWLGGARLGGHAYRAGRV